MKTEYLHKIDERIGFAFRQIEGETIIAYCQAHPNDQYSRPMARQILNQRLDSYISNVENIPRLNNCIIRLKETPFDIRKKIIQLGAEKFLCELDGISPRLFTQA